MGPITDRRVPAAFLSKLTSAIIGLSGTYGPKQPFITRAANNRFELLKSNLFDNIRLATITLLLNKRRRTTTYYGISMVAMASDVKLDLSMRIVRHGDLAKVAVAAEVSVVAAMPCAEDVLGLTVGFEAANAPSFDGLQAADKHSKRRAWPGRNALDIAKNLLRWKVTRCVNLPLKTGSPELAYRPARNSDCARRSVHGRHGVRREAGPVHADRAPRRPRQGGCCR